MDPNLLGLSTEDVRRILALKHFGYEEVPPTIDEFIEDPHFLGGVLDGGNEVYPYWRQALRKIFPNPFVSPYIEVIATGAIGIGKTTFAQIGISYEIAKVLMLRDPHETFGLIKGSKIEFAVINVTKALAKEVLIDKLLAWFYASPYFSEKLKKASRYSLFPKYVDLTYASRGNQLLGRNILGAVLDEMNFQDRIANQAYDNYTTVLRRMQSRFSRGGRLPGHLWLLSSKKNDDSPLQLHVERSRSNPTTVVFDAALWEVKERELRLSGRYFYVYAGDNLRDPFIIGEHLELSKLPEGYDPSRIVRVPIEFYGDFEKNVYDSLRDLAGVSVKGSNSFLPSAEVVLSAMTKGNPVYKEVVSLDYRDPEDQLLRYFKREELMASPKAPRYLHIDLALTRDRVGIASSGLFDTIKVLRVDPITGKQEQVEVPLTFTDFVIYLQARPGQEIPLFKIRDFILDLAKIGYPIAMVSTDGYQSSLLRQDLEISGFRTALISVDKTKEPYLFLKRSLYEKQHVLPKCDLLKEELLSLVDYGKKIDHPPEGSKDGADAVAGSLWAIREEQVAGNLANPSLIKASEDEWLYAWERAALDGAF